jgi:hypothetical protein
MFFAVFVHASVVDSSVIVPNDDWNAVAASHVHRSSCSKGPVIISIVHRFSHCLFVGGSTDSFQMLFETNSIFFIRIGFWGSHFITLNEL